MPPITLKDELKQLQNDCNWIGIYDKMKPINALTSNQGVWNNDEVLNMISYATAKLSETSINLKWTFKTDEERRKFQSQQKKYRDETEFLRKRCIELKPNNPSYYSNLAYSHYQYVRELTAPGGRRDGKAKDEADKALYYLNKALELSPSRITDLYRKGQLLTEMLPRLLIFNKAILGDKEKTKEANLEASKLIDEGIQSFEKAISIYENFPNKHGNKKRYYKEYVKALYDLARAYGDMIDKDWDEALFVLKLNENIADDDKVTYIPKHLECVNAAIKNLKKCILNDNIPAMTYKKERLVEVAQHTGQLEGVFKLYSLGKMMFLKYWILSGYGQRTNDEADKYRETATEYLRTALEFSWSKEKEKQDKSFIAERLARVYITKKDYKAAITLLEKFTNTKKRPDYYVLYTLSIAYINNGDHSKARKILDEALQNRGNKEMWLGHFLMACSNLISGDYETATEELDKATSIAEENGKKNIDSLLIARSFVHYKESDKKNAVKFLEEADKLNPYRVSVKNYLNRWRV
jgi:Flp pilus assembly protein TadD